MNLNSVNFILIEMENGESSFETDQLLKKWETGHSNLYAYSNPPLFNVQVLN